MNIIKILREWFDPAYKEDDFDRIKRQKQARLKFDRANINPNPNHQTHHCCREVFDAYGKNSMGCCCTGHICKK